MGVDSQMAQARMKIVSRTQLFRAEVCEGMKRARALSNLGLDDYADHLSATLDEKVTVAEVLEWERGAREPSARAWFAACRVADQPQSSVAGESELVPTIYELERQISDLRAVLDNSGIH